MFDHSISIVIPVLNEANNVEELVSEIGNFLGPKVEEIEFVFVDDGSQDNTIDIVESLKGNFNIKLIANRTNMGQGKALLKGMKAASHDVIITMDGDLQVDPRDIEAMLVLKDLKNPDFICSRRKKRAEDPFKRHFPSILGNFLLSVIFNTDFTDVGSSLKLIPRSEIQDLNSLKNIHRYLNIILFYKGLSYEELAVSDRKRKYGVSHYGYSKFLRVLFEILELKIYLKDLKK